MLFPSNRFQLVLDHCVWVHHSVRPSGVKPGVTARNQVLGEHFPHGSFRQTSPILFAGAVKSDQMAYIVQKHYQPTLVSARSDHHGREHSLETRAGFPGERDGVQFDSFGEGALMGDELDHPMSIFGDSIELCV